MLINSIVSILVLVSEVCFKEWIEYFTLFGNARYLALSWSPEHGSLIHQWLLTQI